MTGKRKLGGKWYIIDHYYVDVPDPKDPTKTIRKRKQKAIPVSDDAEIFKDEKSRYDYGKTMRRLGRPDDRRTWATFRADFFRHLAENKRKPKTVARYRDSFNSLERILRPDLMREITHDRARQWKQGRAGQVGAGSVNAEIRHLRAAFKKAVFWHYLETDPFQGIELLKVSGRSTRRAFTPQEMKRILKAAARWDSEYWVMVVTLRFTGLRVGEFTHLRAEDVDLRRGVVRVVSHPCECPHCAKTGGIWAPKDYEARMIPLDPELRAAVRKYPRAPGGPFSPSLVGGARSDRSVEKLVDKLLRKAGIKKEPGLNAHAFRHTFGTESVKFADLPTVKNWMGHSKIETTMIYVHENAAHSKRVMAEMARRRRAAR